jgi:tRNA (guanine37-N1)-methyltransferase
MEFHVLTIFPGMFDSPFRWGVLARALERGTVRLVVHDIRAHAIGPHQTTDDYPYGGGEGMVMRPDPIFAAAETAGGQGATGPIVLLSPQGEVFHQAMAQELAQLPGMILVCGRYEGVDERVHLGLVDREISLGDYILTGGELAAMVIMDAVARLLEGVLGNQDSPRKDSFQGGLLKYPQYTRPPVFRGMEVPPVLLSGNHGEIERWRRGQALRRTWERRPELLEGATLSPEESRLLEEIRMRSGTAGSETPNS